MSCCDRSRSSSGLLVGDDRDDRVGRRSRPARPRAYLRSRRCARSPSSDRSTGSGRSGSAGSSSPSGFSLLLLGLFGGSGISFVGLGALLMLVGVFVVSPLFARRLARVIGAPLTKVRGIVGSLSRENAARNPRRTATTGAAVMIAVSLVGFITIFAASANASIGSAIDQQLQDRLHRHAEGRGRRTGRGRLSPALAEKIAGAAGDRGGHADAPRNGRHLGESDVPRRGRPDADREAVRLRRHAGRSRTSASTRIAVSTRKADSKHLKVGDVVAGALRADRNRAAQRRVHLQEQHARRRLHHLACDVREELRRQFQLDQQIFAKLKPGVTAAQGRGGNRSARGAVPERGAEGQRAVQGRSEEAGQPGPDARLRVAVPGRDHRVHRDRQHDDAVDLRADPGDRALACGWQQPAPSAIHGALGGGDHRACSARCWASGCRCSSVGQWSIPCTIRASRSSPPRPARSSSSS